MKKLPAFWKRITRPEEERRPDIAKKQKQYIERNLKRDKEGLWGYEFTHIQRIERNFGYPIRKEIRERIGNSSHPISILDLGTYVGTALGQLKKEFGSNVRTVGLSLAKAETHRNHDSRLMVAYSGLDKTHFGDFKSINFRETFDFIYSHKGVTFHSFTPLAELDKIIKLLRPEGTAVLDFKTTTAQTDEVVTLLHQHGLRKNKDYFWHTDKGTLIINKPKRKLPSRK